MVGQRPVTAIERFIVAGRATKADQAGAAVRGAHDRLLPSLDQSGSVERDRGGNLVECATVVECAQWVCWQSPRHRKVQTHNPSGHLIFIGRGRGDSVYLGVR